MSSSTIYSDENQAQSPLIKSVAQLQLIYDDLIQLPMDQNNIKNLLSLLIKTDSEILSELEVTNYEIHIVFIDKLKNVLKQWHTTNSLTEFDSYIFHSVTQFFIKINFNPKLLIKPIKTCLDDIEQYGKYLLNNDQQSSSSNLKDFSKLLGLYTDNNEEIMRQIIQCLCSKYYLNMFQHPNSSGGEFMLLTCPTYWMNYKGLHKEEMSKILLNTLLDSSNIHQIIEKYSEPSPKPVTMLLNLLNHTINIGFVDNIEKQILLTDVLLSSVLNRSSITTESMIIIKSSIRLLLTLINKNPLVLKHVQQQQQPIKKLFQSLSETETDAQQIFNYLQTSDTMKNSKEPTTTAVTANRTVPMQLRQSISLPNQNRENKEEITLIYYDKNLNCDKDIKNTTKLFQQINDYILICSDRKTCLKYIRGIQTEKIILVLSEITVQDILDDVHKEKQVDSIYIFCMESTKYEINTQYYKINGIYTEYESLLIDIQQNIYYITKQLQAVDIFNPTRNLDLQMNAFKQVLLKTEYDKQLAKKEFIDICRNYYRGNEEELQNINDFERTYHDDYAIRWYTKDSFVYRLVNKALRIEDYQTVLSLRFYITELCKSLQKEYEDFNGIIHLYRGQQLTRQEIDNLKQYVGKTMATTGFLSTSRSKDVALKCSTRERNNPDDIETVMIEIEIDTSKLTIPLADITLSPNDKEVLFDLGASFTVQSMNHDDKDKIWYLKLTPVPEQLITERVEALLSDCKETDMSMLLGELLYKTGQYSQCRIYFENLLKTFNDNHRDFYKIYEYIGRMFGTEGEYDKACMNCTKAFDGYVLKKRWEEAATTTFYISICYADKHDRDNERLYLDKAYHMFKKEAGVPDNYHQLGWIMSAYSFFENDNQIARDYLMKALKIFENPFKTTKFNLNDRDRAIAETWKNIAERYSRDNNDEKVLECLLESEKFRRKHIITFNERKGYAWCIYNIYACYFKQGSNLTAIKEWEDRFYEFVDSNQIKSLFTDMSDVQKLFSQRKTTTDELLVRELNTLKMLEKQSQPLDYKNIIKTHMNIGLVYMKIKDEDWARRHFLKAFELSENQLEANTKTQAQCFYDIGSQLIKIQPDNALKFLKKSLIIQQIIFEGDHVEIGDCHKDIGDIYFSNKLFDQSLEHYNKALKIYEKYFNNDDNVKLDYGNCLSNIARIYERQNNYDQAIEIFLKAIKIGNDIIDDQPCFLCTSYRNLAIIHGKKSQNDLSISFYKKFLEVIYIHIAKQSLCTVEGNHTKEISDCLLTLGYWYMNKNEYNLAINYFEQLQKTVPDTDGHVWTSYTNIALCYTNQQQFVKAIENYKQGITHLEKYTPNDYTNISLFYSCLAECYDNLKQHPMAIDYFKKAIIIYEQHLPDNRERYAATLSQMSSCYTNMGKTEYQNAIDCIRKSLNVFERYYSDKKHDIAQCYLQYSLILFHRGEYNQSIDAAQKSLQLRLSDETNKIHMGFLNLLIGSIYYRMFQYQQALDYAKRAMKIYEKPSPQLNNDEFIASIYYLIGVCFLKLNQYDEALTYENKSYEIRNNILPTIHEHKTDSFATLALTYSKKQDYVKSREYCEKALDMCEKLNENEQKTETRGRVFEIIGELYLDQHKIQNAREYYGKALQLMKDVLVDNHPDIERIQEIIDKL